MSPKKSVDVTAITAAPEFEYDVMKQVQVQGQLTKY